MLWTSNYYRSLPNLYNKMCGIAGQFNFQRHEPVERETIVRMARSIAHRGPDDEGFFIAGPVGLGFRRLSIIDLAGGHQPMSNSEATVWIIFNGEIYNYKELRAELQSKGHEFRTNSDTEVIIHGYEEWGTDVFNHLNGMFGLAIWDVQKERLILARDAMGIKLIYYKIDNGTLTFGSEIRAILAAQKSRPDVDPTALNLFLRFRYTPSPLTIFQGIRKLAPGTMLVVEKDQCREERWYKFSPTPFPTPKKKEEAVSELLELYRGAVKRHLLSDVPVGVLLSGGLDSGLLLALMNEQGGPWPAYTIGYGESFQDDELTDAAVTAGLLGARHVKVKLDQTEFERALPKIVECLEEPIATSSIVPMYFVSQRARQDVKVALIGQGPDELFGGYTRHLGIHYGNWWRGLPAGVRSMAGFAVNRLPRNETLKRGVRSLSASDRLKRYQDVFSLAPSETIDGLFREDVLPERDRHDLVEYWDALRSQMEHTDELGGFQLLEIRSSLPDELLMYGDKLSMAHSLEVRVPYLDRTVVEYVQRLGANLKVRNGTRKWLHRQICQRYLSQRILKGKKRGFAANVVDQWFRSSLNGVLREVLLDENSLMFGLLNPTPVRRLLEGHQSGRQDNHKLLFSLVMLEQWLRRSGSRQEPLISAAQEGMDAVRLAS
jgi:asparagine synthase (glutamine-hydrolysing)